MSGPVARDLLYTAQAAESFKLQKGNTARKKTASVEEQHLPRKAPKRQERTAKPAKKVKKGTAQKSRHGKSKKDFHATHQPQQPPQQKNKKKKGGFRWDFGLGMVGGILVGVLVNRHMSNDVDDTDHDCNGHAGRKEGYENWVWKE